jgi:hypothetical protein
MFRTKAKQDLGPCMNLFGLWGAHNCPHRPESEDIFSLETEAGNVLPSV